MKRLIISLFAVMALVMLPGVTTAQMQSGMWEIYPSFNTPTKVIDTPDFVYVLSGQSLIGLDKETDEIVAFNTNHRLNSNAVSNIWYSRKGKYLLVAHTNGMIDLVYDDGRTVNIADLSNTTIDYGTINDADFTPGRAYLALSKGILVLNTDRGVIDQIGLFLPAEQSFERIAVTDSKVVVVLNQNGRLFTANRNADLTTYKPFNANDSYVYRASNTNVGDIMALAGDKVLKVGTAKDNMNLSVVTIDPTKENNQSIGPDVKLGVTSFQNRLSPAKNGIVTNNATDLIFIDENGELIKTVKHGVASLNNASMIVTNWDSDKSDSNWLVTTEGISRVKTDGTVAMQPVVPAATSGSTVGSIIPASDGSVYLSTVGLGQIYDSANGKDGLFNIINNNNLLQIPFSARSIYRIAVNPKNTNELVIATFNGLIRYDRATGISTTYTEANSSLVSLFNVYYCISDVKFDADGNLFAIQNRASGDNENAPLHMVSADDWNNGAPKASWQMLPLVELRPRHSTALVIHPSGYVIATGSKMTAIVKFPQGKKSLSEAELRYDMWDIDADGMSISGDENPSGIVDSNLRTWIANDLGVIMYPDIEKAFNGTAKPQRPKISRNDGTNLADFLLDNVFVLDVATDSNGCLWFATKGSGLLRVSGDGTEILDQFTTDDSDIPSNTVLCVYPDPTSNKVYVGTDQGLAVYYSHSTPAKRDYKDVYAYPNPVTPDYTGYITIAGLMKDSLVKIADSAGRIVHEGKSDGGSLVWDGCDASGSRVKSGVYFVYASQNANGSSTAVVTKIVVVN